jgi:Dor1-like family
MYRFKSVLAEIDEGNVPDYIRQYTDAHRVHMFDIVTQFRAIFYDPAGGAQDTLEKAPSGTPPGRQADAGVARSAPSPVLSSWAHHCMEAFVERLDALLPSCALARAPVATLPL